MDYLIVAISLGSVYALLALGYALVYSCLKLINFAHGEFCMLGAFAALGVVNVLGWNAWLGLLAALIVGAVSAMFTWFIAYRPLEQNERSSTILAAIGASICLQQLVARTVGAQSKSFSLDLWRENIQFGNVYLDSVSVLSIVSTALLLILVHIFWRWSMIGLAARATADDREAAAAVGIPTQRIILLTFAFAGMAAGIAGVVLGGSYSRIDPTMGFSPALKAFVAALAGGLYDPRKAAFGGLFLGILETTVVLLGLSAYRDAIVLLLLVAILLIRARISGRSYILQTSVSQPEI